MALTKIRGNTQILEGSVTNAQIANKGPGNEDGILLSKIEDGELLVKSDGSVGFTGPVSGVAPVAGNDLATKDYVDATAQGLDVKASVRAVATSDVPLTGLQTIDGVALAAGDRVLLTGQTATVANGIYVVAAGGWTRALDATTNADVTPGLFTFVEEGDANAGTGWVLTSTGPTTLGTTPLPFAQFSAAGIVSAGNGLSKTGNELAVVVTDGLTSAAGGVGLKLDGSTLTVGPDGLRLADLGPGQLLVGSAGGVATPTTISGDVTIDAAGVVRIAAGAVAAAAIADGSLALSKLQGGTSGQLVVAGANGVPTFVTVGGDATIDATGAVALSNDSVNTEEIVDGAVTLAKIAPLPAGSILMGTTGGTNVAVTLSGDLTVTEAGVVSINPATVVRVQDMVNRETPAGAIDGVNDTFVLANAARAGTECVYVNGILQDSGAGNDYTIAGDTITMLYLLNAGDKLRVSYFI